MAASTLEREVGRLSLADRWRLLRWIAARHPAIVRDALTHLPALQRQDVAVRSWVIREPGEKATEGVAGMP